MMLSIRAVGGWLFVRAHDTDADHVAAAVATWPWPTTSSTVRPTSILRRHLSGDIAPMRPEGQAASLRRSDRVAARACPFPERRRPRALRARADGGRHRTRGSLSYAAAYWFFPQDPRGAQSTVASVCSGSSPIRRPKAGASVLNERRLWSAASSNGNGDDGREADAIWP
jgi:hypothetical protein